MAVTFELTLQMIQALVIILIFLTLIIFLFIASGKEDKILCPNCKENFNMDNLTKPTEKYCNHC